MCKECDDTMMFLHVTDQLDTKATRFVDFYYCEPVWASGLSKWCIRPRGYAGMKTGGGVDTESLCGRVPVDRGWDIDVPITLTHLFGKPAHVCSRCMEKLEDMTRAPSHFSIEGKGTA